MVSEKTKAILLTAVILVAILAAIIGLYVIVRISSIGRVKSVNCKVYWDTACSIPCTSIDWGVIEPGGETNRTVYIKNTSNVPINLTLGTENWVPDTCPNWISLYWTYDNSTLLVFEVYEVTFILEIAADITGIDTFSFDIVIIGWG